MQPLIGSMSTTGARALTRSYRGYACSYRGYTHTLIKHEGILTRRQASSKATPRKASPKPLPYQPGTGTNQARPSPNVPPNQQQKQQSQNPKDKKAPMKDLIRERWIYLFGSGAALLCLGYFTASLAMYWRQEPAPCYPFGCEPDPPSGRPSIQSPYEFDLHLDKSEHRFGITKLRRALGTEVRGHVLEVAVGTGRNFEFYNWDGVTESLVPAGERMKAKSSSWSWQPRGMKKAEETKPEVLSFTGIDISPGMLDISLRRMRQVIPYMDTLIPTKPSFAILAAQQRGANPNSHTVSLLSNKIRLLQGDIQNTLPSPPIIPSSPTPTPKKYDTILQTFGLCSVTDPVNLLTSLADSLEPNTGRILLLEHGRSIWDLVNGLLDRGARGHHERFGCWWNRDIEVIVHEAARRYPGLEIVRLERPGWTTAGTHVVVELRVRDDNVKNVKEPKEQKATGWGSLYSSLLSSKPADEPTK